MKLNAFEFNKRYQIGVWVKYQITKSEFIRVQTRDTARLLTQESFILLTGFSCPINLKHIEI